MSGIRSRRLRPVAAVFGLPLTALIIAGCSASGRPAAQSSTGAAESSAAAAPTGSEVKIMVITTFNNPALALKQMVDAAQARVDKINADGGLNGHKLVLVSCDENLDPNQERACVNEAITEKVSAVVGSALLFDEIAPLEKAKIPLLLVDGITNALFNSPTSYPTSGLISWYGGAAVLASKDGAKTVAIGDQASGPSESGEAIVKKALQNLGVKLSGVTTSQVSSTDLTADAAALVRNKPDAVVLVATPDYTATMIKALKQEGYTGRIYCAGNALSPETVTSLGATADGVRVALLAQSLADTSDPLVSSFLSDMSTYEPKSQLDEDSELSWSAVYMFAEVMKDATSYSGTGVIAALNSLTAPVSAGLLGSYQTTGSPLFPQYSRVFSASFVPAQIQNGKVVATAGYTPIDASVLKN